MSNRAEDGAAPYGRLLFHCDNMFARTPQAAISLYGAKVEEPSAPMPLEFRTEGLGTSEVRRRHTGLSGLPSALARIIPERSDSEPARGRVHDMTTEEAREMLDLTDRPFVFFLDQGAGRGQVLYRRYDRHYGSLDPATTGS